MSTTWNSGMLRIITTMRLPRPTPSVPRPVAILATRSPYSAKVISPQPSPSFHRRATRSPWAATVPTNAVGTVRPSTVAWIC